MAGVHQEGNGKPVAAQRPVSVVILTYNKANYTRLCLEGLWRTRYRPLDVVVVDNGSGPETIRMLEEASALSAGAGVPMQVLRNEKNVGAPGGRNQGIAVSQGEFLLFLDNDAIPFEPDWLSCLVDALQALPEAGAVAARLLYPFPPHRIQFAGCAISRTGRVQYIGRGAERTDPLFRVDREVQCLISACLLMPADLVREAGGFDEAFSPVQYEDLDLCYRIREQGRRCYVAGGAEVYHFENVTTDGSPDINFRYVTIKNGMLFKERWRRRFQNEGGPADSETAWIPLPHRSLEDLGAGWTPWEE